MKNILAILVVMTALFLSTFAATPAHAVANDATPTAQVVFPLHTFVKHKVWIQIEGRAHMHGLRRFAHEADIQLPNVRIFTHGKCSDHPHAECVRVHFKHYGKTSWYAQTAMYDPTREIQVNLDNHNEHMHAVMCHEFGHVLGLQHHADSEGVDGGVPDLIHLSQGEIDALNAYYGSHKR